MMQTRSTVNGGLTMAPKNAAHGPAFRGIKAKIKVMLCFPFTIPFVAPSLCLFPESPWYIHFGVLLVFENILRTYSTLRKFQIITGKDILRKDCVPSYNSQLKFIRYIILYWL